ncbi:MAG: ribulose-phosphate 3-epimerase [Anaerolineaceae bacterium]
MNGIILSSSILSADFSRLGDQIREAEQAGVDWIHIDVMDGHFVPNLTMGPFIVEHCRKITSLPLDVHLMVKKPEKFIHDFAAAGSSSLTVHIEGNPNVHRTLQEIHDLGCKAGIAINPGTPTPSIFSVISLVDMVLVMSVNPGYSGQKHLPETDARVQQVSVMLKAAQSPALIQVDGGITAENLKQIYLAGARVIVAATSIFKFPQGIQAGVSSLRDSIL